MRMSPDEIMGAIGSILVFIACIACILRLGGIL